MKKHISLKTKKLLITLGCVAVLAALLLVGSAAGGVKVLAADNASTVEKRVAFLAKCGWEADPSSEEEQSILIPERFTPVYQDYNELQKQQGYDLEDYAGRSCTLYTYAVTNYPDKEQTVLANLYVYKNQIIGADVHSTNLNGFMMGIK